MTTLFDKVVWAVALIILIPVLLNPAGWPVAVALAMVWLAVSYGSRELLDLEKRRREGERGMVQDVRNRARHKQNQRGGK